MTLIFISLIEFGTSTDLRMELRSLCILRKFFFFAISATKIYGPYYFSTSVNKHNYLEMLKVWFWYKHLRTSEYKKYYFQQDGTPPHTSNIVQEWLA